MFCRTRAVHLGLEAMVVVVLTVASVVLALQVSWTEAKSAAARTTEDRRLKIAAFNIQSFGENKMADEMVLNYVIKIVKRYDVILIQEVRDKCEKSIRVLKKALRHYNFAISDRLGRSVSKEQYAYFYRTERVLVLEEYQYEDPDDVFEREPFVIKIAPVFAPKAFVSLIALHSKPTDATAEIGNLTKVVAAVTREHPHSEPIIMGDLNADCSYSNHGKRVKANDFLTAHFDWLIGDDVDTTTKDSTQCAYDRIIVKDLANSFVVDGTAKIYNYTRWYRLDEAQSLRISDHYPVEVQLEFD